MLEGLELSFEDGLGLSEFEDDFAQGGNCFVAS